MLLSPGWTSLPSWSSQSFVRIKKTASQSLMEIQRLRRSFEYTSCSGNQFEKKLGDKEMIVTEMISNNTEEDCSIKVVIIGTKEPQLCQERISDTIIPSPKLTQDHLP